MKYENNGYILYYNECDKEYINDLIYHFNNIIKKIYKFFNINKLSKKLIIYICNDNKLFKDRNENSVGFKDDDKDNHYIYILSYKLFIKRKGHEDNTLDYYYKTIVHEFVHVVHEDKGLYRDCLIWIREGIAIYLSNQYGNIDYKMNNCVIEDLLNNKRVWYINYYSLIKYACENYGEEYLKNLINDISDQKKKTIKLYNELVKILK